MWAASGSVADLQVVPAIVSNANWVRWPMARVAAALLPQALFGPHGGTLPDCDSRRLLMIEADAISLVALDGYDLRGRPAEREGFVS